MIKVIIVDDELHCQDTLSILLTEYCPGLQIVERCNSGKSALLAIHKHEPELVFLDIEMPGMSGFQLLEHFPIIPFAVIFATSHDQYAIRAIRFSALDYLLKPIDPSELVTAVNKVKNQKYLPTTEQFTMLLNHIQNPEKAFHKIAIPTVDGYQLIPAEQVVRCEANDNYTSLYLKNMSRIIASRTLKEIEEQLINFTNFIRVHHSYIVNLNEVSKYIRGEGGYLIMSDGATVNVSRSRKEALLKFF